MSEKYINFVDVSPAMFYAAARKLVVLFVAQGLSQRAVADAAGVSQATVSRALKDPSSIKLGILRSIAKAVGTSLELLLSEEAVVLTPEQAEQFNVVDIQALQSDGLIQIKAA